MLVDSKQRNQATNPLFSFIVQAPAGSGKTEILTQRYLRLLSTVTAPEQIVALTFTRKAASEMRERIFLALQHAAQNKHAETPHQKMTLDFATDALQRDTHYQWNLLQQPNRLKIITIDSLCQSINQAIPLLEKQIAYSQITDKPSQHYLNAGRRCIQFALNTPEYQAAIKTLLLHVDNRQDRLLELFKALLAQRDQWLAPLFQARVQKKSTFEHALQLIETHELNRFTASLPEYLAQELLQLARQLAHIENNPDSPRHHLQDWFDFQEATQDRVKALRYLVLTADLSVRKSFDHHVGLLSTSCPKEDYKRIKEASQKLLATLSDYPEFIESLIQVSQLPAPLYNPEQWEVLHALFQLLPLLVSHLHLLFSEENEVDFTALSQQALSALGDEDNPTDLSLYLDNTLHHILVDEFQDTSITQFELLTKLVWGWQEGDGKTLFIVGDPMQSIYRFRQAEVGLFFRAKEYGIGPLSLIPLELSCNFRSTNTLVDWVNTQFASIFPKHIDIESGAVTFHPSVHVIEDKGDSAIHAIQCDSRNEEAEQLVQLIQEEMEIYPNHSMAILVRSRTQLNEIIQHLRQHNIPYQGTDITLLTHLSPIRDVWSLTQALLYPANRLSWLALLRSPYCGLSLSDLHALAQFDKKRSIYFALLNLDKIPTLSEEGMLRAVFFSRIMQQSLTHRHTDRLSEWIIQTHKALHGDAVLTASQSIDLEQFWFLLDRYDHHGSIKDITEFMTELNKLYSNQANPSRLHIMTIHKSKGLEFDTVFLPGLGTPAHRGDNPLMRWLNLPTPNHGNLLLMSPMQAAHQDHCPLYDYLAQIDEVKSRFETQRLLYVAATRAKSRLYLLDHTDKSSKSSFRSLLQHQEFRTQDKPMTDSSNEPKLFLPKRACLPLNYLNKHSSAVLFPKASNQGLAVLSSTVPRLTGIVAHRLLQWICENHPNSIHDVPWSLATYELRKHGFDEAMQQHALSLIQEQITRLFDDEIGLWIVSQHEQAHNEYELLIEQEGRIITRIIDRFFEEQGTYWIIDFKTGKEDSASMVKHQTQLNEYAFHLSHRATKPIFCGVYYLQNNHWMNWAYVHELESKDIDIKSTN